MPQAVCHILYVPRAVIGDLDALAGGVRQAGQKMPAVAQRYSILVKILDVIQFPIRPVVVDETVVFRQRKRPASRGGQCAVVAGWIEISSSGVRLEHATRQVWASNGNGSVTGLLQGILPIVEPTATERALRISL